MQVENDNVLDFLFVNAGIPLSPSGGFDITYKLASLLKDLGFNVGILFIRDIFRNLYRIYPDRQLRYYLENHLSYSVFSNIVNRKSGLIPLKLLRKLLGINYEENLKGLRIFFSNGMQPTESKRIIANGWHNALIINEWDVTARKFILAQQDDADARWNPLLSHLALRAFSSGIPIISTNRIVTRAAPQAMASNAVRPYPSINEGRINTDAWLYKLDSTSLDTTPW